MLEMAARMFYDRSWLAKALAALCTIALLEIATGSSVTICQSARSEVARICSKCDISLEKCCEDETAFNNCLVSINKTKSKVQLPLQDGYEAGDDDDHVDKRARPFLGKRARPFLGKRDDERDDDNVRALDNFERDFSRSNAEEMKDSEIEEEKRARPFLGKRHAMDMDKRTRPFLGKRKNGEKQVYAAYKRPRPFLGKRVIDGYELEDDYHDGDEKRARPFLGKRSTDETAHIGRSKRARPFLGKRARPFLGKRADEEDKWEQELAEQILRLRPDLLEETSEEKRARPFLG